MSRLRTIGRWAASLAAAGWWLLAPCAAWAQAPAKKQGDLTAWTLPYGLVILGVALGMLFVCHSSRRRDRARPEEYAQKNILGD